MISHPSETIAHWFHGAGRPILFNTPLRGAQTYTDYSFKKIGGHGWENPSVCGLPRRNLSKDGSVPDFLCFYM